MYCSRWTFLNYNFVSADVAQQFQYAVRVIGSNFAPTVERDEFLVAEKIKKERKFNYFSYSQYDLCFIVLEILHSFFI